MKKTQYVFGLLLLIVCCMGSANAQPAAGSPSAPSGGQRQRPGQAADLRRGVDALDRNGRNLRKGLQKLSTNHLSIQIEPEQ